MKHTNENKKSSPARFIVLLAVIFAVLIGCDLAFSEDAASDQLAEAQTTSDQTDASDESSQTSDEADSSAKTTGKSNEKKKKLDYGDYDGVFAEMKAKNLNGKTIRSSAFKKYNYTLVNTWNISCTYCIEDLSVFQQISEDYADSGIGIMGLYYNYGENLSGIEKKQIKQILSDADATYKQIVMNKKMYGYDTMRNVQCFPTTFIVDSDGVIIYVLEGARDYDGWAEVVEVLL